MNDQLIALIHQANPWLTTPEAPILNNHYIPRLQTAKLLSSEWDNLWLVLVGPRQAGKTTLAKFLSNKLIEQKQFNELLYLNCDLLLVRQWLTSPLFIQEAMQTLNLKKPIILIDEVQRLENPGLLLKACADLKLNIKMIATGSSQLELKSRVQEFLTGRQLEVLVLPLSYQEIEAGHYWKQSATNNESFQPTIPIANHESEIIFGCYPAVVKSSEKNILLRQIYGDYISKDIIEILKINKPDVMQKLITLIAHSSGQLVNYNQLATDCGVSFSTIQHYLSILENTYMLARIIPFVGNKRKEITSNPIFYFIDNGFRNQALHNLLGPLDIRQDKGLLIQNALFQELLKFKVQHFYDYTIHFWRTQSGAEVDFILHGHAELIIPIEAKYRSLTQPTVSRGFRSFIEAYSPSQAFIITKNYNNMIKVGECHVYFISFNQLSMLFQKLKERLPH